MIGGNRTRDFARDDEPQKDVELTLGPLMLAGLAGGLLALCFVCFVAGYVAGRHTPPAASAAQNQTGAQAVQTAQTAGAKPSAIAPATRAQSAPAASADNSVDAESDESPSTAPTVTSASVPAAAMPQAPAGVPLVHPALPAQGSFGPQTAPQPPGVMVQVAAVSQMEDAQVLVAALRKRGITAAIHRDAGDGMLHVQVGPFANRNDANIARQRLLSEGYNAVVQ